MRWSGSDIFQIWEGISIPELRSKPVIEVLDASIHSSMDCWVRWKRLNLRGFLKSPIKYIPLSTCKYLGIELLLQCRMRKAITLSMLLELYCSMRTRLETTSMRLREETAPYPLINRGPTQSIWCISSIFVGFRSVCVSLFRFDPLVSLSLIHFQAVFLHNSLYRWCRGYLILRKIELFHPIPDCIGTNAEILWFVFVTPTIRAFLMFTTTLSISSSVFLPCFF